MKRKNILFIITLLLCISFVSLVFSKENTINALTHINKTKSHPDLHLSSHSNWN